MKTALKVTTLFLSVSPVYGDTLSESDQTESIVVSTTELYQSKNEEDRFIGYFLVPDASGHNFMTCNNVAKRVSVSDVDKMPEAGPCEVGSPSPFAMSFSQFLLASVGTSILDTDGNVVGEISSLYVDKKEGVLGYLIDGDKELALGEVLVEGSEIQPWFNGQTVQFLAVQPEKWQYSSETVTVVDDHPLTTDFVSEFFGTTGAIQAIDGDTIQELDTMQENVLLPFDPRNAM